MTIQLPHRRTSARPPLASADVDEAAGRITGFIRPLTVLDAGAIPSGGAALPRSPFLLQQYPDPQQPPVHFPPEHEAAVLAATNGVVGAPRPGAPAGPGADRHCPDDAAHLHLVVEATQGSGSFKARGALNYALYHIQYGVMPPAGVTIAASGSANSAVACAWAAAQTGTKATAFASRACPAAALDRLRFHGAEVRVVAGDEFDAEHAAQAYGQESGALYCRTQNNMLLAAGAGTLALEIVEVLGDHIDTIVVPVVGGTLLSGTIAAIARTGIRIVPAEAAERPALAGALAGAAAVGAAGGSEVAADFADLRFPTGPPVAPAAVGLAEAAGVRPVAVPEHEVAATRRALWEQHRLVVERTAALGLAALRCGAYTPEPFERVVVVLTGGNTEFNGLI